MSEMTKREAFLGILHTPVMYDTHACTLIQPDLVCYSTVIGLIKSSSNNNLGAFADNIADLVGWLLIINAFLCRLRYCKIYNQICSQVCHVTIV